MNLLDLLSNSQPYAGPYGGTPPNPTNPFDAIQESMIADVLRRQELQKTKMETLQRNPPRVGRYSTKDDLEQGRQTTQETEDPYIRFALPTPTGEMGPMTDYTPGEPAPFAGQGGFMDAQGTQGGGAFSGSSTPVVGKTAMGNPMFDWSGVANPGAFEAYGDPIRDALMKADQVKAEKLAQDPMWEEKEKARIWTESQVGIQMGIREALQKAYEKQLTAVVEQVRREFPNYSPNELKREVDKRMNDWQMSQGDVRTPTSFGMPGSVFGG